MLFLSWHHRACFPIFFGEASLWQFKKNTDKIQLLVTSDTKWTKWKKRQLLAEGIHSSIPNCRSKHRSILRRIFWIFRCASKFVLIYFTIPCGTRKIVKRKTCWRNTGLYSTTLLRIQISLACSLLLSYFIQFRLYNKPATNILTKKETIFFFHFVIFCPISTWKSLLSSRCISTPTVFVAIHDLFFILFYYLRCAE